MGEKDGRHLGPDTGNGKTTHEQSLITMGKALRAWRKRAQENRQSVRQMRADLWEDSQQCVS